MSPPQDNWSELGTKLAALKAGLGRCKAVNVNTAPLKAAAQATVQHYFRVCRPELMQAGISEPTLQALDSRFQDLLRLTSGNNPLRRYRAELSAILSAKVSIDAERERRIGESLARNSSATSCFNGPEAIILRTLEQIVPTAALSYRQACLDLASRDRVSYRGTASELREALRELLDHLAPDVDVQSRSGFKFEEGQKKPTMKQKVRFILKARGSSPTATEAPESAVTLAEEMVGRFARSAYNRSSLSAHVSTVRGEVCQLKMYVDSVLGELLEIHRDR